jgi:hypothetical protein
MVKVVYLCTKVLCMGAMGNRPGKFSLLALLYEKRCQVVAEKKSTIVW